MCSMLRSVVVIVKMLMVICVDDFKLVGPKENLENKFADTVVLFFLNHWAYNVNRSNCISLLERIANDKDVKLIIKKVEYLINKIK